jgi:serine/threonine protein kinase/WD40 repeat protein
VSNPEGGRNPVERLAEEFLARYRGGECPSPTEYAERHPELADEIREVFPALLLMEEAGPAGGAGGAAPEAPRRLGDYRVLREVGRGGMGVVYEAVQESLGRHVALKVLPLQDMADPLRLERFRREARSAAKLHHSNIVPVYEVGECAGTCYYAMQFIRGQGLDQVLGELRRLREGAGAAPGSVLTISLAEGLRTGQFPAGGREGPPPAASPAEAISSAGTDAPRGTVPDLSGPGDSQYYRNVARLGAQAAEALAHAHGQKVLHRDIKPANLLLDVDGNVWVTDFGLAKEEGEDLTRTGDVLGTLRYLPPERLRGVSDARGDVYGLGVTLYELLTLRPAFNGEDRGRLLKQLAEEDPPRPRSLERSVPRDLETVVLKATAKEPRRRYQSAEALAEDLRRFLADRPVLARRSSALEHAWRWCRRNPALGGASLLAAASALATVAVSVWFGLYQAEANEELRRRQGATEAALFQSRLGAARLAEERGLGLLRQGETNPGLLWLAHALELAPEEAELRANLRRQLAWWHGQATPLRQVLPHPAPVWSVAFSPDGQAVFTGCGDGKVRRWEARSGKLLGEPAALAAPVGCLVPSADGKTLCALNTQERRFLDATSGEALPGPRGAFPPWDWLTDALIKCSADGKTVIKMQRALGRAGLPMAASGTLTAEAAPGKTRTLPVGLTADFPSLTLSRDGKLFLICTSKVEVRSTATGVAVGQPLRDYHIPNVAAFRPDGKVLLTADVRGTLRAWDVLSGERLGQPLPHPANVNALAYSPDGRLALTACSDGAARLWDLAPPGADFRDVEVPQLKGNKGPAQPPILVGDGRWTVVDAAKKVYWHDGARTDYRCTLPLGGEIFRAAAAHGGQVLATASVDERNGPAAHVRFWNASTGEQVGPTLTHPGVVWALAFSPDGATLATACTDGNVRFWKVGTDTPAGPTLGHPKRGSIPFAFSPDGGRVFTGCADTVRLWDRATGEVLETFPHPRGVRSLAVGPGGRRLLVAGGGEARLWDVAARKPVGQSMAHPREVYAAAFSPDGQVALTVGSETVQLWEAATALPLGPPLPNPGGVAGLAFAPDRAALIVTHGTGYRLFPLQGPVPDDVRRLALSAQVLTGLELDEGGAVQILDAAAWNDRRRQLEEAGGSLLP